ncbi:hypothetical protein [Paenibacillus agilis]|uniref:Uncharacterized protein n=1 Tax=Paenibacillus agilis TaxID=3020863 RepID=A0A559IGN4_9BACL|nr:hypothetical protein [Paenibacillus agilis]TVX86801.1 hypothetical protein FPZ44_23050 [Paenibacillus agilis]
MSRNNNYRRRRNSKNDNVKKAIILILIVFAIRYIMVEGEALRESSSELNRLINMKDFQQAEIYLQQEDSSFSPYDANKYQQILDLIKQGKQAMEQQQYKLAYTHYKEAERAFFIEINIDFEQEMTAAATKHMEQRMKEAKQLEADKKYREALNLYEAVYDHCDKIYWDVSENLKHIKTAAHKQIIYLSSSLRDIEHIHSAVVNGDYKEVFTNIESGYYAYYHEPVYNYLKAKYSIQQGNQKAANYFLYRISPEINSLAHEEMEKFKKQYVPKNQWDALYKKHSKQALPFMARKILPGPKIEMNKQDVVLGTNLGSPHHKQVTIQRESQYDSYGILQHYESELEEWQYKGDNGTTYLLFKNDQLIQITYP